MEKNIAYMEDHQKFYQEHGVPIRYFHFTYPKDIQNFLSHWHDEMEITYIEEGIGKFSIETEEFTVKEGDIVLISPNVIHAGEMLKDRSLVTQVYVVDVNTLCYSSFVEKSNEYFVPIINGQANIPYIIREADQGYADLKACLFRIKESLEKQEYAYEIELKECLFRFFLLLYRNNHVKDNQITSSYSKNDRKMKEVIAYIEQNYEKAITVEQLAEISGFSTCYFMNIFKKYTGLSCITFINQFRLDQAARKLLYTTDSILSIAMDSGFNNISFFNRTFKKYFGKTPREYRANPIAKRRKEEDDQTINRVVVV